MNFDPQISRVHSLDALRTLAALAVVLAHWPQHFFSVNEFGHPASDAPFYQWLAKGYLGGPTAVTFFFCLSGFIFYWLYADDVHQKKIGFGTFTVLRFSRLYPLHFVMLLMLVPLVLIFHSMASRYFIYGNNDAYHFGLNLAFIQYWGLERGLSWNGPSWSISVEIALYLAFFIACRFLTPNALQAGLLMLVSFALAHFSPILAGGIAFFTGGLAYYGFRLAQRHRSILIAVFAALATILIWRLAGPLTEGNLAGREADAIRHAFPAAAIGNVFARGFQIFCGRARELALFPSLIFTFACLESSTPKLPWRFLGGIGNISFGVYLLHYPLQMVVTICALALAWPGDIFTWPSTFLAFFGCLLLCAFASYRYLERPAMVAMRKSEGRAAIPAKNTIDAAAAK
jgi:peptidoglycan/LPS O-acetylase OafA/YrhL